MDDFIQILKRIEDRLANLEKSRVIQTLVFTSEGTLVVPVVTADPSTLTNGQIWYNSTSNELKVRKNGTTRTITTS